LTDAGGANVCKRCLLQDLPGKEADYYQSVLRYRKSLPPKQGVTDEVYEQRLAACMDCDELVNGMCAQCGCYVQMRAAAKKMDCPHPGGSLWKGLI
jgi:hypothetical protein